MTLQSRVKIPSPDDMHLHLRDGEILRAVLPESARHFARAIIMPNLQPPIATGALAEAYRERILAALPQDKDFTPLMTLYMTEDMDLEDMAAAYHSGIISAVKLYPAGATTNSDSGVKDIENVKHILEKMEEIGLPLCIHGEVADPEVDIFDRETKFLEKVQRMRMTFPRLKTVLEHITTLESVEFVKEQNSSLAATITTHHLVLNRNHILAGGIHPHYYCLPIAKREKHRKALLEAAVSGHPKFFLGTDSAPHIVSRKESSCGCAGCFTATNTISILAEIFQRENALHKLADFTSRNGANFYELPINDSTLELKLGKPVTYPDKIQTEEGPVAVFDPMMPLHWHVESGN